MHTANFEYEPDALGHKRYRLVCSGEGLASYEFDVQCSMPRNETDLVLLNIRAPACISNVPRKICQEASFSRYLAASGQAQKVFNAINNRDIAYSMAVSLVLKEALAAAKCSDAEIHAAMAR
jgi:hypothetical protein